MTTPKSIFNTFVVSALLGGSVAAAPAGDRHHRRPDVDIESLRGELWRSGGEWLLEIRYDVEVEDYLPPPGALELILYVTERGHTLVDRAGYPIEFVVPLDRPSEVDDDEIEFEDRITVTLPDGVFHDPGRLRLESLVVHAGDDRPLDRKDKSIKYDRPKPPKHRSVSVGVWAGTSAILTGHHRVATHHRRVVHRRTGVTRRSVSIASPRIGLHRYPAALGRLHIRIGPDRVGDRVRESTRRTTSRCGVHRLIKQRAGITRRR